jgi:hypothetical protein
MPHMLHLDLVYLLRFWTQYFGCRIWGAGGEMEEE